MTNPTREEELSFYFLYLKNYIESYKFAGVTEAFMRTRAELAEETYENARRNGAEVDEAHELSMAALLDGFRYSDYEIIMDVLEEEFSDEVSEDMRPFMKHWKELDIRFDAVYSGFLGSFEQLDIVKEFFSLFKREDNLILVDPVMGDNGELYKIFTPKFAKGMRSLCERADIIVPNLTEAALLLGEPYQAGPYTKAYIDGILHKLSQLGPKQVVLTGVYFDEKELGAATFDMERNATEYVLTEKIPGYYHGTGDVFASALLSGLLNNFNLERSAEIAVRFTAESILRTFKAQTDYRFGVNFEQSIPDLLKELKLI